MPQAIVSIEIAQTRTVGIVLGVARSFVAPIDARVAETASRLATPLQRHGERARTLRPVQTCWEMLSPPDIEETEE